MATFAYLYDLGAEQWAWKAEMGPGGDDEQIDGASETVAKAVPRKEGKVFRAVPQWQSEVVIKRTSPSSESRGKVRDRYDGVLALQDNFYIEGMPVYSAVAGDEDILWLFSYDGRWIFARLGSGYGQGVGCADARMGFMAVFVCVSGLAVPRQIISSDPRWRSRHWV